MRTIIHTSCGSPLVERDDTQIISWRCSNIKCNSYTQTITNIPLSIARNEISVLPSNPKEQ